METVTSADGTVVAFDRYGDGPPVVVVGGALGDRARARDTALAISATHTVLNYDRRGRGDSGDNSGDEGGAGGVVRREIQDLAAVIAAAGSPVIVYGHSSGAALALRAAAGGVPMRRLVLHDPPYGPDTPGQRDEARAYLEALLPLLRDDRRDDAVALFLQVTGVPDEVTNGWRTEPWWPPMRAMAHTLAYDAAVLGYADETGGSVPRSTAAEVTTETRILVGEKSPPFMHDTARTLRQELPHGTLEILPGQDHAADPEVVARAIR